MLGVHAGFAWFGGCYKVLHEDLFSDRFIGALLVFLHCVLQPGHSITYPEKFQSNRYLKPASSNTADTMYCLYHGIF